VGGEECAFRLCSVQKQKFSNMFRNVRAAPRPVRREEPAAAKPSARKPSNSRRSEAKQPERGRAPAASKNPGKNEKESRGGGRGKKV
jgi:hypothetical protein